MNDLFLTIYLIAAESTEYMKGICVFGKMFENISHKML